DSGDRRFAPVRLHDAAQLECRVRRVRGRSLLAHVGPVLPRRDCHPYNLTIRAGETALIHAVPTWSVTSVSPRNSQENQDALVSWRQTRDELRVNTSRGPRWRSSRA